jgi:hypothetical protein
MSEKLDGLVVGWPAIGALLGCSDDAAVKMKHLPIVRIGSGRGRPAVRVEIMNKC